MNPYLIAAVGLFVIAEIVIWFNNVLFSWIIDLVVTWSILIADMHKDMLHNTYGLASIYNK